MPAERAAELRQQFPRGQRAGEPVASSGHPRVAKHFDNCAHEELGSRRSSSLAVRALIGRQPGPQPRDCRSEVFPCNAARRQVAPQQTVNDVMCGACLVESGLYCISYLKVPVERLNAPPRAAQFCMVTPCSYRQCTPLTEEPSISARTKSSSCSTTRSASRPSAISAFRYAE